MFQPAAFFDLQGANTIAGAIGTALVPARAQRRPDRGRRLSLRCRHVDPQPRHHGRALRRVDPAPDRTAVPNPLVNSYPTADDRWLYLVCLQADRFWGELCEVIGRPDLTKDERFADMSARAQNAEACVAELEATFRTKTLAHWREQLDSFSGVWAPVLHPAEVHDHVQVDGQRVPPRGDVKRWHGLPPSGAPHAVRRGGPGPTGPAPEHGQHTEEILLELGRDWEAIGELRASGALG